jgi:signal transduction histidine kinase
LNKHLLKMALAHVLRNAIEATETAGEIQVSTAVLESLAQVTIQDNGRGMSAEVVERIFEPFYTTKIGGTGLGMVFVRQIVDEHRGEISLFSQVGQGTAVVIRLPLRFQEPSAATGKVDTPNIA